MPEETIASPFVLPVTRFHPGVYGLGPNPYGVSNWVAFTTNDIRVQVLYEIFWN